MNSELNQEITQFFTDNPEVLGVVGTETEMEHHVRIVAAFASSRRSHSPIYICCFCKEPIDLKDSCFLSRDHNGTRTATCIFCWMDME